MLTFYDNVKKSEAILTKSKIMNYMSQLGYTLLRPFLYFDLSTSSALLRHFGKSGLLIKHRSKKSR